MNNSVWVSPRKPYIIKNQHGEVYKTIPTDRAGLIKQVDEESGRIYVHFPEAHVYMSLSELKPADLPSPEFALRTIQEFEGHHCGSGEYQFNIKFYEFPPDHIKEKCGEDRAWSEYNFILENELRYFMGDDCDGGLRDTFDWIDTWHTSGRSGGWLVINHFDNVSSDSLETELGDIEDEVVLEDEDREHVESKIIYLAMCLQYIQEDIIQAKESLEKWIKSDEPWEPLLDSVKEEVIA